MVALLPGLAAALNPAERTMVRSGIPLTEPRIARPLPLRRAPVSQVAASHSSSGGAPETVRQRSVGIRDP